MVCGPPAKTQISLGIRPESSLSTWRKLGSLATHWLQSEDTDQTGRMPRLIWVFAGRTSILLVLSWGGSNIKWATSWQNLFTPYANNKDAHQPTHPCRLISFYGIRSIGSIGSIVLKNAVPEWRIWHHFCHLDNIFTSVAAKCFDVSHAYFHFHFQVWMQLSKEE